MSTEVRKWFFGGRITYDSSHDDNLDEHFITQIRGPALVWFSNTNGQFVEAMNVYMVPDGVVETYKKPRNTVRVRVGTFSQHFGNQPQQTVSITWNDVVFGSQTQPQQLVSNSFDTIDSFVYDCRVLTASDDGIHDNEIKKLQIRARNLCGKNRDIWNTLFHELIKKDDDIQIQMDGMNVNIDEVDETIIVGIIMEMKPYFQKLNTRVFIDALDNRKTAARALFNVVYMLPSDQKYNDIPFMQNADQFVIDLFELKLQDLAMQYFTYLQTTSAYKGHMMRLLHSLPKIYSLGYKEHAQQIAKYLGEKYIEENKGITYLFYNELCHIGLNDLAQKLSTSLTQPAQPHKKRKP